MTGNRPFNELTAFERTVALTEAVKNAYYLKNREIPANLAKMVEVLCAQIMKRIPAIGSRDLHENIETYILNETTGAISVDLLFKAACRGYDRPRDLRQYQQEAYTRPDTEADTVALLDTLAATIEAGRKPYANWHREYIYLVKRDQLDIDSRDHFVNKAVAMMQAEAVASGKRIADFNAAQTVGDVTWRSEALAVIDWMASLATRGLRPSDVLRPLMNETSYREIRKIV